jgi:outer membrane biosynthesis protein TonB
MRSSAARLEQTGSSVGIVIAVLLHVIVIAATLFTLQQHTLDIVDQTPMVPVDLVTIAPKTNIMASVKQKVEAPPKEEPVDVPKPQPAPPTPAAPQEAAAPPEESAEPAPQKPIPKVEPKTKSVQEPKKADKFDVNNILAMLDKRTPSASAAPNAHVSNRTVKGFGAQTAMTADLVTSLRNQIASCWSPPVGAPQAADLVVDFDVVLKQDGSVAQASSDALNSPNSYTRAAASAAQRAIYTCSPYKLPADRYNQWSEINPFHFDPRQMMGQ